MSRLIFSVVVVIFLAASASGSRETRVKQPLKREGNAPIVFSALGADYTLPNRWTVVDHFRAPGRALIQFVDDINGCEGALVWLTETDEKKLKDAIGQYEEQDTRGYTASNVNVKVRKLKLTWKTNPVDMRVLDLSTSSDRSTKSHYYSHFAKQQLGILGNYYCKVPGVEGAVHTSLKKTIESMKLIEE